MKRLSAFLSFLFISFFAYSQTTLLNEDFGTGSSFPTGWSEGGDVSVDGSDSEESDTYTGASGESNVLMIDDLDDGSLTFNNSLSTVGYTTITVQWGAWSSDISAFPSITFEWNAGSGWNSVSFDDISSDNTWALVDESGAGTGRIPLPVGAEGVSNLQLRWTFTAIESLEEYRIDDVTVQGSSTATQYYSKSTGNLEILSNWGPNTDGTGTAPANFTGANTTYEIRNRTTATIGAAWTVSGASSKVIAGDGTNATNFTIPSGFALTGTIDVNNNATLTIQNATLPTFGTITNGTIDYAVSGAQNVTATTYKNLTISGSGVKTLLGASTVTGSLNLSAGTFVLPSSAFLTLSGTATGSGTITGSSSARLEISGTGGGNLGTLTFTAGSRELQRLDMRRTGSGAAFTLGSDLEVSLRMQHESGTVFINGNKLTISEEIELEGGEFSGSSTSDLEFNTVNGSTSGDGLQGASGVIFTSGGRTLDNLTLNVASTAADVLELQTDLTIQGTLALTDGTFEVNGNTLNINGSISGTSSNLVTTSSSSLLLGGSTAFSLASGTTALTNFTVSNTAGVTLSANLAVSGTALVSSGGSLTAGIHQITGATANVTVNGTVITTNTAGFSGTTSTTIHSGVNSLTVASSSTVNYNLAGAQTVTSASGYGNLILGNSGLKTFQSGITSIQGNFTLGGTATVDATTNSSTIEFSGSGTQTVPAMTYYNLSSTGSGTPTRTLPATTVVIKNALTPGNDVFDATTNEGTVEFSGSVAQSIPALTYHDLTLNNTNGASLLGNVNVNDALTVTLGTLSIGTNTLTITGDLSVSGALSGTETDSKIVLDNGGTTPATTSLPAISLQQLTIDRSGSNRVQLTGDITVGNSTTITSGILNIQGNTLNVKNAFSCIANGFESDAGGTVDFESTTTLSGSGFDFANVSMSGAFASLSGSSATVSGNWTNNTASSAVTTNINFDGSGAQAIDVSDQTLGGTIEFSVGGTKTLTTDMDANSSLTISGGTFNAGGFDITSAGTWNQTGGTFTAGSGEVTFDGGSQNITATSPFNDVTMTGGTKSLQATTDIDGNLTFATTLDANGQDINLAGNWTNNGGSFTYGTAQVIFDGTTQTIGGSSSTSFYDMDVDGTSLSLANTAVVDLYGTISQTTSGTFDADGAGGGVFTLKSTSITSEAQIGTLGTPGNFTGTIYAERFIEDYNLASGTDTNGLQWRYIAAPVTGANLKQIQDSGIDIKGDWSDADFAGPPASVRTYDAANGNYNPLTGTGTLTSEVLSNGTGYLVYSYDIASALAITLSGEIVTGAVGVSMNTDGVNGWNLIPNPYPSRIDWDNVDLSSYTGTGLSTTISFTDNGDDSGNGAGLVTSYQQGGPCTNCGSFTGVIAMGQSFWTNIGGGGTAGTLTFQEDDKSASQSTFLRTSPFTDYIRVTLSDGTIFDENLIFFYDLAEDTYEPEFDAYKLANPRLNLSQLNIDEGETDLVINTLGSLDCQKTVKLNVKDVEVGSHLLKFTEFESFEFPVVIRLHDKFLNQMVTVPSTTEYAFEVTSDPASYGTDRFELAFIKDNVDVNIVVDGSSVCEIDEPNVVLATSKSGVGYQAFLDDVAVSEVISGIDAELAIPLTTLVKTPGEYSIVVKGTYATCHALALDNIALVTINGTTDVASVVDGSTCANDQAILKATGAPSEGSYKWYLDPEGVPLDGETSETYTTPALSATTSYYVSVVNANGCEGEKVEVVGIVTTVPNPEVTGNSICNGGEVTLSASGISEGEHYQWYKSDGTAIDGETTWTYITPELLQTTTYSVSIINTIGCESEKIPVVAEISTINAPLVTDGSACFEGSATLVASGASEGESYRWYTSEGGIPIADATSSEYVTPPISETKTYYVRIIGSSGCEGAVAPVKAEINAITAPTVVGATGCLGSTVVLKAESVASEYRWYTSADGSAIEGATGSEFSITELTSSATYYVSALSGSCESSRMAVSATVDEIVAPVASNTNICAGSEATLSASSEESEFRWYTSSDGTPIEGETSSQFTTPELTSSASYFVSSVNSSGCESVKTEIMVSVTDIAKPEITKEGDELSVPFVSGYSYQWYDSENNEIDGANESQFEIPEAGDYYVVITSGDCSVTSNTINAVLGIEINKIQLMEIYPNPVNKMLHIEIPDLKQSVTGYILSTDGKVVDTFSTRDKVGRIMEFDVSSLKDGLYYIKLTNSDIVYYSKFFKN